MSQHFLLSPAARSLSVTKVARMTDDEAHEAFRSIRWADTKGEPTCPRCGCLSCWAYKTRKLYRCKGCDHMYSVTSGTTFSNRKLAIRDYLLAIILFVNGSKGRAALQMSRELDVQYKTAFVLCHKLREALSAETKDATVAGEVAVDGAYFGGHVKPANRKENRVDRRLAVHQNGKRRVVVIMRERGGRTLPFVFKSEGQSINTIADRVKPGSTVFADEATHWDALHSLYLTKRINHQEAYSADGVSTNMAESFFSRLRRAEIGTHHHISGPYLHAYASEMAWREDYRREGNGEQFLMLANAALTHPVSRNWKGYWQRAESH